MAGYVWLLQINLKTLPDLERWAACCGRVPAGPRKGALADESAAPIKGTEAKTLGVVRLASLWPQRSRYAKIITQTFPLLAKKAELLVHHRCDLLERLLRGACTLPLEVDFALEQYSQRLLLARIVQELFDGSLATHLECVGINLRQGCPILKMEVEFDFRGSLSQSTVAALNRFSSPPLQASTSWSGVRRLDALPFPDSAGSDDFGNQRFPHGTGRTASFNIEH